ncbi:hypothetical protein G9A89_021071 [Geosiphon pyriformis]|nr:hypothetical protein G9A89_021071 [Geosiphon pyriformis]
MFHEYDHSTKNNVYRRRSHAQTEPEARSIYGTSAAHRIRRHSPPPPHAHHQPISKFNSEFWMQDFRKNVMETLFKEERFKAFQKRRNINEVIDNMMDTEDDEYDWVEQQKIAQSNHILQFFGGPTYFTATGYQPLHSQNQWAQHQMFPSPAYQQWVQQQQQQHLQHQQQEIASSNQSSQQTLEAQQLEWQHQIEQQQQAFLTNLPIEIANAVQSKNLPPEFYQFRERREEP